MAITRRVLAVIDQRSTEDASAAGRARPASVPERHAGAELGRILRDSKAADVVVALGGQPEAVVISIDRYRTLVRQEQGSLNQLAEHFDALVAGLQGADAAEALEQGFSATPEEMSRVALAAARRARGE